MVSIENMLYKYECAIKTSARWRSLEDWCPISERGRFVMHSLQHSLLWERKRQSATGRKNGVSFFVGCSIFIPKEIHAWKA